MNTRPKAALSPDLTSLIHHVELSRAGWRDEAFKTLLLSIINRHGDALSLDALCKLVNQAIPAAVSRPQIEHFLTTLESDRRLLKLPDGQFKLSEHAQAECARRAESDESLTSTIKQRFHDIFSVPVEAGSLDWSRFHRNFLTPLVLDLGARTYELVTGDEAEVQDVPTYRRFMSTLEGDHRSMVSAGLANFLDPSSTPMRQYMLRLLNNAFLARAIALPEDAMNTLLDRTRQPLRVRVFVDTNFLFSLLGLHENPADDVVRALYDVLGQMPGRINVQFFVLPFTVDEAQRTLDHYADELSHLYMNREVAKAIDSASSKFSGIVLTYARKAYRQGKRVSAKDYLSPYVSDFIGVARNRGIELFNANVDDLAKDDDVVTDVLTQMEHQSQRPEGRRKSYDTMLHDMMLWHFVRRQRPSRVDSPLDAKAWVATIDYGLLRFDALKKSRREPPVCIHPTSLLQLFQLWVPSSDLLTRALMKSLRPILPRTLDYEAEKTSIRIVKTLSRFESGDLSEDAASHILLSDAVRERIGNATDLAEEVEIIESEIVKHNRKLAAQLDEAENRAHQERKRAEEFEKDRDSERTRRMELGKRVEGLIDDVESARRARTQTEAEARELKRTVDSREEEMRIEKQKRIRRGALARAVVSGTAVLAIGLYIWRLIEISRDVTRMQRTGLGVAAVFISLAVALNLYERLIDGSDIAEDSRWTIRIRSWRRRGIKIFWAVVAAVVSSVVTSFLRQ